MKQFLTRLRFASAVLSVNVVLWLTRFNRTQRGLVNLVMVTTSTASGRLLVAGRTCAHEPLAIVATGRAGKVEVESDAMTVAQMLMHSIQGEKPTVN